MSTVTNTTTTTKWWWSKKSKKAPLPPPPKEMVSSGADEGASMFSLYSYDPSIFQASSSIRAQHTKSEYSGNYSDVESNASILSKPWISRNMIENTSIRNYSQEILDDDSIDSVPVQSSNDTMRPKRRASLVDYIVNKPLHGKLRAGFGKLVGRSQSNIEQSTASTPFRRSSIS